MNETKVLRAKRDERILSMANIVKELGVSPTLAIVVCQDYDQSSTRYVNNKIKISNEIGIICEKIEVEWQELEEEQIFENLCSVINRLNIENTYNGIIVQLPLPLSKEKEEIICNLVSQYKDVDGFHYNSLGKMVRGQDTFISCTPLGVMNLLSDYNIEVEGKKVAVIGRSKHVGLPLVNLLINKGATVVSCNSKTKDIENILKQQDIVISAVGKAKIWNETHFNENAVLIDIGINVDENGKLCGDIDTARVNGKVSAYTPVPGGVGVMTVLSLMENVIKSYKKYK